MDEVELLLTDEFAEFSEKIRELHATRKTKTEEFKKLYAQYQEDVKNLDKQAADLYTGWETWKTNFVKSGKKEKVGPH